VADGRQNLLLVFYVLHLFETNDVFQEQNLKCPISASGLFIVRLFIDAARPIRQRTVAPSAADDLLLAQTDATKGASACNPISQKH
jgi:hypothetical protein